MSVRMSVLAMLAQQPSYGYLLRAEFDRRTGAPKPLNVGQVYKVLEMLERDGFVTRSEQTDADGHVFYEASAAGRVEVERWLSTPEQADAPARSDLAVKVAIASTLPGVDIERMLALQRQAAIERLQQLTRATAPDGAGLGPQLAGDAIIFEAETEVRWLDHVAERIRAARAAGTPLDVPFDTEPPKRGRPRMASKETS
ncbi:PadR family transcriptional regulator [Salinibacterium sp. dk2585]|uniref:PadR family transcriptional regulator n=1 Tax=unclassified Salinibacterium TaxID=2632331 RepID=UPI0011C247D6|nr:MULTISPECIES: PadR family transcriptional regulator [unclassified Salinibacterium]QEE60766.1 PadR family transcriptional regulator [Salinibacterium sp. dk2585]TXK55838.1 PadR family transcriptional regulator [Salinibacterium sp. dk5596]